ncbi:iron ABC transporter substrate-binding protein [Solibacillus sp. MA9]|uniref:Iron ABC transporter substrate-binding protein n=1 Tax=Solibacillus palustris TaxID=2908203 RepID=A0ABS9U9X8_9BACL|nr:iron ABC transporter substrate-binding protein [Solibacillus sp. MA9]MCH7321131.1 iron ABC transporter substrate-binding protein [Solibacillus sp. MA9]
MKSKKFLSWKGISIYLTIILFLVIFIQMMDQNKRDEKEGQYLAEIEKSYLQLVDFQTYIINDEVQVDSNKHVLVMAQRDFQYQLSLFIDIFGNKEKGEYSLYDFYAEADKALQAFYDASTKEQQTAAHEQLLAIKQPLFTLIGDQK